ncbi:SUKH-3 domain-containing protein [Streptodolium elevatio]
MSGPSTTDAAAAEFLRQFGGLSFPQVGSDFSRTREEFALDLLRSVVEEGRFVDWDALIGQHFVPIGDHARGREFIGLDATGEMYVAADWVGRLGAGIYGPESLLLG